jgi:hypothetical protein
MAAPFFHSVGDLALTLFRPPPDATSGQVRRSGAFGLLVGGTLFTLAIAGLIGLGRAGVDVAHLSPKVHLVTVFPGLAFLIIGGFRIIAGQEPEGASSFRRIGLGVIGALFSLILLLVVVVGTAATYESLTK